MEEYLNSHHPEEETNGLLAFATLGDYLEEDGWHPTTLEGKLIYRVGFSGKNGQTTCYAQVRDELEQFFFYVMSPTKVPEDRRHEIAEFITRANYGLRIGNFEMDYRDGEVRYKSSLDFEKNTLTDSLIRNAIYPAVHTMDRYLHGMMRVVYGGLDPAEAIEEIEA